MTGRAPAGGGKPRALPWPFLLGAAAAAAAAAARLLVETGIVELPCPFRETTGIPCPTCGGMRALAALASFDPAAAFLSNPAVALAAAGAILWAAAEGARRLLLPDRRFPTLPGRFRRPLALLAALLWALNWAYLIAAG